MEELLEILNEIDDSIDYENETALIDDQLLDSFAIITLVSELEDAFDICRWNRTENVSNRRSWKL